MRIRIQSKILASFMAMVALIIALLLFTLFSIRIMADGTRRLVYVQKKSGLITDLQMTLDRAVTALGEYMVSGKKSRRATFIQLVLFYTKNIEALERSSLAGPAGKGTGDARERAAVAALKAEIAGGRNPKDAKVMLAKEITARFHNAAAADAAEQDFINRSKGGIPDDIPEVALSGAPLGIGALHKQAHLAPSSSEANRLIDGGGVRVDGAVVSDKGLKLDAGSYVVQVGKRKFARVSIS